MQLVFEEPLPVAPPAPFTLNPNLCSFCASLSSAGDLDQCSVCRRFFCLKHMCDCFHVPLATLRERSKQTILSKFNSSPSLFKSLPSAFTVEDEYGNLEIFQGDFSSLTRQPLAVNDIFCDMLPDHMAKHYETRQLAVWKYGTVSDDLINLSESWDAAIMPLLIDTQRYTVTLFIAIPKEEK